MSPIRAALPSPLREELQAYVRRGLVAFQWGKRGHAVLRASEVTPAGHLATAGADRPGYNATACPLPAG